MADFIPGGCARYLPPLLDALRAKDPDPLRPAEVCAWLRATGEVPPEDLIPLEGQRSVFEHQVHWARFHLAQAGLLETRRGLWSLTPEGRAAHLRLEDAISLCQRIRETHPQLDEATSAPGAEDDPETAPACWLVSVRQDPDLMSRFRGEGLWQYAREGTPIVRRIRPGDRLAAKCSFTLRHIKGLAVGRRAVAVMRIFATGTVLENMGDGRTVKVAWDPPTAPRDWYFYTYRSALAEINPEKEGGRRLIDFLFRGIPQDISWFLEQPYWQEKYGEEEIDVTALPDLWLDAQIADEEPRYSIDDILEEGCFLPRERLEECLERWHEKKNLILQGPPGTGKTWLARRLGCALMGADDRETTRSRLRVVQFHPSMAYEDFVRGWRPSEEGRLTLVEGILMQAIRAAEAEPDRPFVLVIEEINRGNPAQIFGEMLTLLEAGKRKAAEGIELTYRREPGERVHVPENLYLIGTMNLADRSLALVDLALRRRFAFIELEPVLGPRWRAWCRQRGLEEALLAQIEARILALNQQIAATASLGPQLRIGQSYVTPEKEASILDGVRWFRGRVETQIGPLLDEYWYDAPEEARAARSRLLAGIG